MMFLLLFVHGCGGSKETADGGIADTGRLAKFACSSDDDCDDGIACTDDRCQEHLCTAVLRHEACDEDQICDPRHGCVATVSCTTSDDCADEDACTSDHCDEEQHRCIHEMRDEDMDGQWPTQCGGLDCDDMRTRIPVLDDVDCDGLDGDCDGKVDEGIDTRRDPENCGACGIGCLSGVCEDGECASCGHDGEPCCTFGCELGVHDTSEVDAALARWWMGSLNECYPNPNSVGACVGRLVCVDEVCRDEE